jgi:hypothetical protein
MSRQPRPVFLNAVQRAIERAAKLNATDREAIKGIVGAAFESFRKGQGNERLCADLVDALNTGEVLCEVGICSDEASRARICAGLQVLGDVIERHQRIHSWTLRGPEIEALDTALWMHRVQLDHCSLGEFESARGKVAERARQALAGNVGANTKVVSA